MCAITRDNNIQSTRQQIKSLSERAPPILLKPWIFLYRVTPRVLNIPILNIDITFALCSASFLYMVRAVSTRVMINLYGWPETDKTSLAAASVVAITHSTLLCPALLSCLLTQPYRPSSAMISAPIWWRDGATALILFTTGYMLQDTVVTFLIQKYVPGEGIVLSSSDWSYVGHHLITVAYMLSALKNCAGHISAMVLMLTGEVTNPAMNALFISQIAKDLGCCGFSQDLHNIIEVAYAVPYVVFRVLIGPVILLHMVFDMLLTTDGRANVHAALGMFWCVCAFVVLAASLPWCEEAMGMIKSAWEEGRII